MALTKSERQLLMGARKSIQNHEADYVCHGLDFAAQRLGWGLKCEARKRLRKYIYGQLKSKNPHTGQIEQHYTLEDWQQSSGRGLRAPSVLREDRIAWINWILGDYYVADWKRA